MLPFVTCKDNLGETTIFITAHKLFKEFAFYATIGPALDKTNHLLY
jgi:hypothetical protein